MHRVERIIAAAAGIVWRLLTDTREWLLRRPSVRAMEAPSALIGPGMRGRIQTPVGLWLPFETLRWASVDRLLCATALRQIAARAAAMAVASR